MCNTEGTRPASTVAPANKVELPDTAALSIRKLPLAVTRPMEGEAAKAPTPHATQTVRITCAAIPVTAVVLSLCADLSGLDNSIGRAGDAPEFPQAHSVLNYGKLWIRCLARIRARWVPPPRRGRHAPALTLRFRWASSPSWAWPRRLFGPCGSDTPTGCSTAVPPRSGTAPPGWRQATHDTCLNRTTRS